MTKNKLLLPNILYFVASLTHIYGQLENPFLEFVTKPFIMITLIILYLSGTKSFRFLYFFGMVFSLAGDIILEFGASYFTLGLVAFLLAHIFYILVSSKFLSKVSIAKIATHSIPFLLIFGGVLYTIYPNLGALLIPVIVYGIVISAFGVVAFLVYTSDRRKENFWLFLGAVIFIASDSILALNKFYRSSEFFAVAIMVTYITAQYLICQAMIAKSK